jgi:hypothetical protein
MDDQACRHFFSEPRGAVHRRYEALRAVFLDGLPLEQVADRFGYRPGALKSIVSRFRAGCRAGDPPPFLFRRDEEGHLENAPPKMKTDPSSQQSPIVES